MTVRELSQKLQLKVVAGAKGLDHEIGGGYCGDLLSFVMGHANEKDIWITVQAHMNSLAVAVMLGLSAIVLTEGSQPDEAMCNKANEEQIPILVSEANSFKLANQIGALI